MELTEKERKIVMDLAGIAWQAGAIRSPQQAQQIQDLVRKVAVVEEKPAKGKAKGNGEKPKE